jgi:hypothetical protein
MKSMKTTRPETGLNSYFSFFRPFPSILFSVKEGAVPPCDRVWPPVFVVIVVRFGEGGVTTRNMIKATSKAAGIIAR